MSITTVSRPRAELAHPPAPDRSAAGFAIGAAVVFTGAFTLLGFTFDYPAVLDAPAGEILTRYASADAATRGLWYLMLVSSAAFVPLAVLLGRALDTRSGGTSALGAVTTVVGVLAGVVQAVGFARWTFAVPYLADTYTDPASSDATRDATVVAFEVLHRFVGGALGEHLGFALTGIWAVGISLLLLRIGAPPLLAAAGVLAGATVTTGVAEATGATWPGLPVAGGYLVFAAWLVVIGAMLLTGRLGGRR